MTVLIRFLVFLSLAVILPGSMIGQVPDLRFKRLGIEQGLSNMSISALHQDQYGFIWIGTWDGINRYDGHAFEVFRTIPEDTSSLIFNEVKDFLEVDDHSIWVSTYGGLTRWDQEAGTFLRTRRNGERINLTPKLAHAMASGQAGKIYVGNNRGNRIHSFADDGAYSRISYVPKASNNHPTCLMSYANALWIGGDQGLHILAEGDSVTLPAGVYFPVLQPLMNKKIQTLMQDAQGNIWIGTATGLWHFQPDARSLKEIFTGNGTSIQMVQALAEGPNNQIWIGTQNGLIALHKPSQHTRHFHHKPDDPYSLSQDDVRCLLIDRSGALWVGTDRGGLNQANLFGPEAFTAVSNSDFNFPHHELVIFCFEAGSQDQIWVGTNQGLFLMERKGHKIIQSWQEGPLEKGGLAGKTVTSLHQLPNQKLLISTRPGGLQILDQQTGSMRACPPPHPYPSVFFREILPIAPDTFIMAGNLGIWRFASESLDWELIRGGYFWSLAADSCSIFMAENGIWRQDICQDSLLLKRWIPSHHDARKAMTYLFREGNSLWIGTYGMGLIRMDLRDLSYHRWTRSDGLPSNYIFGILQDQAQHLWLSTTEGLARFSPLDGSMISFGLEDGLMDQEFNTNAAYQAEDGAMYFGGNNGFVTFYPSEVHPQKSRYHPPVQLTSIRLAGKPLAAEKSPWLTKSISFQAYPQQHLEIGFAVMDFSRASPPDYQYRLMGWDSTWTRPLKLPLARFTNIPPGTYQFQVRSTNREGQWTSHAHSLAIIVEPLWHQTWLVRYLTPLLGLLGLTAGIWWYLRRARRRERKLLLHRIADIRQAALSAQMDHHFTFNALNSIQRFITENNKEASLYYIVRFGKLIRRFLDQARKQEHPIEDEITTLELYLSLEILRCEGAFQYRFEVDLGIDPFNTDIPTSLLQPLVENAIWHGLVPRKDRAGELIIGFHLSQDHLILMVTDNGVGKQASSGRTRPHHSKGIQIIQERLQALGTLTGQPLSLEYEDAYPDSPFSGTRVSVFLPHPDL